VCRAWQQCTANSQISSQKIVGVQIQPLIAILYANLLFTNPLLGWHNYATILYATLGHCDIMKRVYIQIIYHFVETTMQGM
jgi:hypothetical protein